MARDRAVDPPYALPPGMDFPALFINPCPGSWAVRALPDDLDLEVLIALTRCARDALGGRTVCLALGPDLAYCVFADGRSRWGVRPPEFQSLMEFRPACLDFLPGPGVVLEDGFRTDESPAFVAEVAPVSNETGAGPAPCIEAPASASAPPLRVLPPAPPDDPAHPLNPLAIVLWLIAGAAMLEGLVLVR